MSSFAGTLEEVQVQSAIMSEFLSPGPPEYTLRSTKELAETSSRTKAPSPPNAVLNPPDASKMSAQSGPGSVVLPRMLVKPPSSVLAPGPSSKTPVKIVDPTSKASKVPKPSTRTVPAVNIHTRV